VGKYVVPLVGGELAGWVGAGGGDEPFCVEIPQPGGVVAAGGGEVVVGADRQPEHALGVVGEGDQWLAPGRVGDVPQPDGVVVAGGGEGVPVRGERHRAQDVGVAGQGGGVGEEGQDARGPAG
jgi:hypothetical protein